MSWRASGLGSFLWPDNMQLCGWTTLCLPVPPLVNTGVVSSFAPLWVLLLRTRCLGIQVPISNFFGSVLSSIVIGPLGPGKAHTSLCWAQPRVHVQSPAEPSACPGDCPECRAG